jgi:hypothetical protein
MFTQVEIDLIDTIEKMPDSDRYTKYSCIKLYKIKEKYEGRQPRECFCHLLGGGYGQKILCNGMKEALDRYITSNYAEVRAYTAYFLSKMGSYIDADTVINNSYLHVD